MKTLYNALLACGVATAAARAGAQADDLRLGVDPGAGLTLEQAMDAAETNSYAARIAARSVDEAEARASQTFGALGPRLSVEATDTFIDSRVNKLAGRLLPNGTPVPNRVETAAATLTQPLVGLGGLIAKLSADAHLAEASRLDAALSKADARLLGADAYVRATKAERLYEVAKASFAATEKQLSDARALERQGRISPVDVMRIELAQSDVKTQLIQARAAIDVAALGLIETIGLPQETPRVLLRTSALDAGTTAARRALPDLKALTSEAAGARLDLKAAENRVEAARKFETASSFDYLPALNGFAKYQRDFTAQGIDYGAQSVSPGLHYDSRDVRDQLSVGLQLNWTIWDWNQRLRRGDELAATVAKSQLVQEALGSKVHIEVAGAHAELRSAQEALDASRVSVKFAEEVYRATELKFQNGLATTTDLINAERDQTRARGQLAMALGDLDFAWLKLKKAAGQRVGF